MASANSTKIFFQFCGAAALSLALAVLPSAGRAQDTSAAQSYVQSNVQTALGILQDTSLSASVRRDRIHAFLLSLLDTQRIALFMLGAAQSTASPAAVAAYNEACRDFMVANYDSKLGGYAGQTLRVTGAIQHAPGDYIVSAVLVDPSVSANGKPPPEVDFRIVDEGGHLYIVDASIEGVWLALAEHDDFQGFLNAHNGDVAALTAHLKDMTAQLNAATN
ncbi:MAG TPA: ABC transporter substrate-binding protein [Rhizomicrobium sp.]|nr:ABC transporter substrate-binding protein [Rhizomicrobium sp.]